jgi:hypothetical protein
VHYRLNFSASSFGYIAMYWAAQGRKSTLLLLDNDTLRGVVLVLFSSYARRCVGREEEGKLGDGELQRSEGGEMDEVIFRVHLFTYSCSTVVLPACANAVFFCFVHSSLLSVGRTSC